MMKKKYNLFLLTFLSLFTHFVQAVDVAAANQAAEAQCAVIEPSRAPGTLITL